MIFVLAGFPAVFARVGTVKPPPALPAGINVVDWKQIKAEYQRHRHAFFPAAEGGFTARGWEQQWLATFDGRGFTIAPKEGNFKWGLELASYGRAGSETRIKAPGKATANVERFSYHYSDALTEWLVNDERGLEHGFTLRERPAGVGDVVLTLTVRGGLKPRVSGDQVEFLDAAGKVRMKYSALTVVDARGRSLPARFEAQSTAVVILMDDASAHYPLTVDPIAQQAYLKASNPEKGDLFGWSVAISGDTLVVGAPSEDSSTSGVNSTPNEIGTNSGAAYVFVRTGSAWSQQAYLKASNTGAGHWFGQTVAISGNTIVVGAPRESSGTTGINSTPDRAAFDAGAAYVFVRTGNTWSHQAYLKASNSGSEDGFGGAVAISGETIAVGAHSEDSSSQGINSLPNEGAVDAGAAYVFVRSGAAWSQQAYLKAFNTGFFDQFGESVSISGDTLVVGASGEDSSATGANGTPNEGALNSGAAYVFARSGSTWSQQAYLKAFNTGTGHFFGSSVAIAEDTIAVGAYGENSASAGVNSTPVGMVAQSGAAYVFTRVGTTWTQQAYLKASNPDAGDNFGAEVAVSRDTLVVGAYFEDSSTIGVNTTPNESARNSGAAYVFARRGTLWHQQAYLKPLNTGELDNFGLSVAVAGNAVVVGAISEDSLSAGVNSVSNEAAVDSGAAYVFSDNVLDGSHFIAIEPCRAVDTRVPYGKGIVGGDSSRDFTFEACNIPANATAVAVNVTLVPSGQFGFLSIWPSGNSRPVASTMNSLDGRIKANAAIVGLGTGQAVSIYVTDPAHVILDVNGYFVPAGTPGALAFYPVAPCRVVDTRNTGGIIAAQNTRIVSGGCLPSNAQAYSLNVTTVPSGPLGFLTLWPAGTTQPLVSTLNNLTGTVVANAAVLRSGTAGAFNAYVTDASHLIADLNGYFAPPGSPGALAFYPTTPCRVFDTRNTAGPLGGPAMARDSSRSFTVSASACGIPSTAQAYVTNATVVPSGVFGFLTLWPEGQARPTVSVLNAVDGALTSNAAIVQAGPGGVIQAYTSDATHLLLDISGYFAP